MAVQTVTIDVQNNPFLDGSQPAKIVIDWKCTDAGAVSAGIASTLTSQYASKSANPIEVKKIRGGIISVETVPGENGDKTTECPTNLYDVTLLDAYGYDVLGGGGANRSNTSAEFVSSIPTIALDGELTLTIANAGNETHGRIIIDLAANIGADTL